MTDADWWAGVRQQRDATKLRELPLWRLTKGAHVAAAAVRVVDGVGLELRLTWNGELRQSQVYRDVEQLARAADENRQELVEREWSS